MFGGVFAFIFFQGSAGVKHYVLLDLARMSWGREPHALEPAYIELVLFNVFPVCDRSNHVGDGYRMKQFTSVALTITL